ncbi:hypothetical protein MAIT1_00800 [Magnetofaba australis IT-1]|uniref:Uncharacterized protein n=2 Tax=Magnetofaba TaxID=1472292 RepID=A0A1Y2K1W1_9PROT|nr:hypothetical protein MAIT1_00800 [Magnetofaba australis IT-1]
MTDLPLVDPTCMELEAEEFFALDEWRAPLESMLADAEEQMRVEEGAYCALRSPAYDYIQERLEQESEGSFEEGRMEATAMLIAEAHDVRMDQRR